MVANASVVPKFGRKPYWKDVKKFLEFSLRCSSFSIIFPLEEGGRWVYSLKKVLLLPDS